MTRPTSRPVNEAQRRIAWQMVQDMSHHPGGMAASNWRGRWPYHSLRLAISCLRRHKAPMVYVHKGRRWALESPWSLPVPLWPRDRLVAVVLLDGALGRVHLLELELDAMFGPVPS